MNEKKTAIIELMVKSLLETQAGYFLVQVGINTANHINVVIDGDEGVAIEQCSKLSRALAKQVEEAQLFPADDYSLEVGSPGIGEPLLLHRQFEKNIGRHVEVLFKDGAKVEGVLKEVDDESITLVTTAGKGKKTETKQIDFLFENIQSTTVQIKF